MGSPDFALPILSKLDQITEVVGVITQPDRPAGRGRDLQPPDVKVLAGSLGLDLIQTPTLKSEEAIQQLQDWSPDLIVVAAFGQILRENVLTLPKYGCLNVHASLLPRWRGAAPIQAALLHDDQTGVTIMKMDRGLDTGDILSQEAMLIEEDMNAGILSDILAKMGADLLAETLPGYIDGTLYPKPQDDSVAAYAPRLKKQDGQLDFHQSAAFLERMVRAYDPWPGVFMFLDDKRLKIFRAHSLDMPFCNPGDRFTIDRTPALGTDQGCLVLDEVQIAGKKRVSGEDFLNGTPNWSTN